MRRREFIAFMGASVAWPFAAMAQEPGRTYRLGTLLAGRVEELWNAFLDPARRHGFIEGQNLTIDYRDYAQNVDLLSDHMLAREQGMRNAVHSSPCRTHAGWMS
jgi:putative ABC transport system substrate-binding protein